MEKHKLKDFIDATKEEAGNVAVEEVLPAVVKEAGGFIVSEGVGMLASEIVGAVVPVAIIFVSHINRIVWKET